MASTPAPRSALVIYLLAGFAALVVGVGVVRERSSLPEAHVVNRPVRIPQDGYVSSDACQACHPSQYASWRASYHRTMTQVATPESAIPRFDGIEVSGVHGRAMRLSRRGRELLAEFDDPDASANPEERPRIERAVVMITGSHHQQIFWYATGHDRLLGQLPGAYLVREAQWIPRRSAVLHPPTEPPLSETGHWNSTCIACHATNGRTRFDTPFGSRPVLSQAVDTTAAELGISCEACHGPSLAHARANRSPLRRYGLHLLDPPDETTILPTRLGSSVSSQVCGQCHGVWEFYDEAGEREANTQGLPFRPGQELSATRFLAQPTKNADSETMKALVADDRGFVRDSFWPDGTVRVSGREYNGLLESPCFKDAQSPERTMTCFSCHTMHKKPEDPRSLGAWADDQLSSGMDGNQACLRCHPAIGRDVTTHTKHPADSSGSACYNCHMPYTSFGLLKTIRSHTVGSPTVAESVEHGRPNACNLCHLDQTLAWTGDQLERWYGTSKVALSREDATTAASLGWLLRGDAGQRAIAAQAMAWPPAQQASGTDWMAPFLAELLNDPYDAVRFIAARTLRTLPGLSRLEYDFVAPAKIRYDAQLWTMTMWDRARSKPGRTAGHLLFGGDGNVDVQAVLRMLKLRNTRRMLLRE